MSARELRPSKIVMLHMNYRSRALEHGDFPAAPTYYLKPPSTLARDGATVQRPQGCELLVAEGEIALVIGERAHRVSREEAWAHVSHVAAADDLTVLDFLHADPSLTRVKGWDGFTPLGPLVDARTVDPDDLTITTTVNGEVRQSDSTRTLLFSFADLVSDLSAVMTLEPDDIILTGTPAGARAVVPGDEVVVEMGSRSRVRTLVAAAEDPLPPLCPPPRVTPAQRAHALGVAAARPVVLDEAHRAFVLSLDVAGLSAWLAEHGIDSVRSSVPLAGASGRVAGHAYTVRLLPRRAGDDASPAAALRPLASVGRDEVVVVAANGDRSAPVLPEDVVERLRLDGAAGILSDGGPPPTPAGAGAPGPARDWWSAHRLADLNTSVVVGGVTVEPGDLVVGDEHGDVLVLPAAGQVAFGEIAVEDPAGARRLSRR